MMVDARVGIGGEYGGGEERIDRGVICDSEGALEGEASEG